MNAGSPSCFEYSKLAKPQRSVIWRTIQHPPRPTQYQLIKLWSRNTQLITRDNYFIMNEVSLVIFRKCNVVPKWILNKLQGKLFVSLLQNAGNVPVEILFNYFYYIYIDTFLRFKTGQVVDKVDKVEFNVKNISLLPGFTFYSPLKV